MNDLFSNNNNNNYKDQPSTTITNEHKIPHNK